MIDYELAFAVLLSGIVIVFLVLAALIGLMILQGKLLQPKKKATKQAPEEKKPAVMQPQTEAEVPAGDDALVAVITAAITAANGGQDFVIKSIRRSGHTTRGAWGTAGVMQNVNPF